MPYHISHWDPEKSSDSLESASLWQSLDQVTAKPSANSRASQCPWLYTHAFNYRLLGLLIFPFVPSSNISPWIRKGSHSKTAAPWSHTWTLGMIIASVPRTTAGLVAGSVDPPSYGLFSKSVLLWEGQNNRAPPHTHMFFSLLSNQVRIICNTDCFC